MSDDKRVCEWEYEKEITFGPYWLTSCDAAFCVDDGTLMENDYNYCPKCGGKIVEVGK